MAERDGRAVVLGASIAGLLAARVLADLFTTVIVVERDRLPAGPQQRRGVPQGRQIHALLTGGQRVLEDLLPGLTAELATDGAPVVDALADVRLSFSGHRLRQSGSGLTHVSASRPLLEHHIRRRIRSLPNVAVLDATEVVDLVGHRDRVNAVRVLRRDDHDAEDLHADLVVDACGRGSRLPVWLSELGYQIPPAERIPIDLGYTTRRFRLPEGVLDGDVGVLHSPTPSRPRGAALARLEENVWMLTLVGVQADHPPVDIPGFSGFAASVDCDEIRAALRNGDPIDHPVSFRFPASSRHRYERVRLPRNLVVLGDSLCSFNPVYGQGMTVAALEARALADQLSVDRDISSSTVMVSLARIVDVPWRLANGADRPFLSSAGTSSHRSALLDRYVERVLTAATHDPVVGRAFLRVSGLLDHPQALFRPDVLRRTLLPRRTLQSTHCPAKQPPPNPFLTGARSSSGSWLFAIIGAAALLKPTLAVAGVVAIATWLRARHRRTGPPTH